jgi:hypothetical protein
MKDKLIKILTLIKENSDREDSLYELGIDLINFLEFYEKIINLLFQCFINKEGLDLIYWWLFDSSPKIIYEKENPEDEEFIKETNLENLEDFVDYIFRYYLIK